MNETLEAMARASSSSRGSWTSTPSAPWPKAATPASPSSSPTFSPSASSTPTSARFRRGGPRRLLGDVLELAYVKAINGLGTQKRGGDITVYGTNGRVGRASIERLVAGHKEASRGRKGKEQGRPERLFGFWVEQATF